MLESAVNAKELAVEFGDSFNFIDKDHENEENTQVIFSKLGVALTAKELSRFPNLAYILSPTTALDHIDIDFCQDNDIEIISLRLHPELLTEITSTAEIILWHILEATRKPNIALEEVRKGIWNRNNHFAFSLSKRKIGIIGFGRIGKQVAEIAKSLKMSILVSDPTFESSQHLGVVEATTSRIFQECSIIVICVTDSKENTSFIDERYFSEIPETGITLINCSRGRVLNERDVERFFISNHIKFLGVDVLDGESQSDYSWLTEHRFWKMMKKFPDRVRITPHIGGATIDSLMKAEFAVFSSLKERVSG